MRIGDLDIAEDTVTHPLLGDAHVICDLAGEPLTAMSALDWERPTEIPTIAEPARLPPGSGALVLNTIAERAVRAHVPALHYAGPYPTPALYRALARSFRTDASEAAFTADVVARALRLARDPLPFAFVPAPHTRVAFPGGFAELRDDTLERAVIAGASYERDGSPGRLVASSVRRSVGAPVASRAPIEAEDRAIDGDHLACELWFGDAPWARVAELSPLGELVAGPHALPALATDVAGKPFPPPLRAALAELVAEAVPAPLAADARAAVAARTLAWADLGARVARRTQTGFEVHAVLWERVAPLGLARLALAIVEALAPVVTAALVAELSPRP